MSAPEDMLRALVGMCNMHDQPGWQASVLRLMDVFVDGLRLQGGAASGAATPARRRAAAPKHGKPRQSKRDRRSGAGRRSGEGGAVILRGSHARCFCSSHRPLFGACSHLVLKTSARLDLVPQGMARRGLHPGRASRSSDRLHLSLLGCS